MTQLTREIIVRVINDKRSKNSILKNFRLLTSTARRKGRCKRTFVWTGTLRDNRLKEMLFLWCEINMHLSSPSWWENKIYIYIYSFCAVKNYWTNRLGAVLARHLLTVFGSYCCINVRWSHISVLKSSWSHMGKVGGEITFRHCLATSFRY